MSKIVQTWHDMAMYEYFKQVECTEMFLIYGDRIKTDLKGLMKIKGEFVAMNTNRKSDITPEMIAKAKEYPFEDLYSFKRNMALCPFHPDSKPSMSLKNNRVRCWSCMDKYMDTIEFTMKLLGLTFPEAVRRLQ